MRRIPLYLIIFVLLLPSCSKRSRYSAKVVKPKYHHWWFSKKKDKKTKRTKVVKMRS
ncbi:hypothetical protein KK083_07765 [Fulvivirgaceae bacterium PWU4]|uniref:Uncharacterized protein n=1 Tax=Chryseosolibacter histidini TaxID=2782349 RepID=A0AAP2DIF6_9BACT|nr:hypothetical protein [Chryseosolibacter histidini]MBT1696765.1 hypothetical protein [Chryseosolibacter histidini]